MNQNDSCYEINMLACSTLLQISQKSLFELFLIQLPNLFNDRVQFLSMINEHYYMMTQAMTDIED